MRFLNEKGFTLIELIIVVIIIGILAAIAVPMMHSMKAKTISAEAVMGLSALRTALRVYYTEYGCYPNNASHIADNGEEYFKQIFPGLTFAGLKGTYFGVGCYYFDTRLNSGGPPYVQCAIDPGSCYPENDAVKADETLGIQDENGGGNFYMDVNTGEITQIGVSRSGYPERG